MVLWEITSEKYPILSPTHFQLCYLMSTTSLLSHRPAEPYHYERTTLTDRLRPRPSGDHVKTSKNVRLHLSAQEDGISFPTFGTGGDIEGTVDVFKPEAVMSVEVKVLITPSPLSVLPL